MQYLYKAFVICFLLLSFEVYHYPNFSKKDSVTISSVHHTVPELCSPICNCCHCIGIVHAEVATTDLFTKDLAADRYYHVQAERIAMTYLKLKPPQWHINSSTAH